MVANVSRALETFVQVESSAVRPGELGCTTVFNEYRHRLDPITKIKPFTPTESGGWVPATLFKSVYRLVQPSAVTEANVHALNHYLKIPDVHLPMFRLLFGFRPNKQEETSGRDEYLKNTVEGKAKALQVAFADLQPSSPESLQSLLAAAKALKEMVLGFKEQF